MPWKEGTREVGEWLRVVLSGSEESCDFNYLVDAREPLNPVRRDGGRPR